MFTDCLTAVILLTEALLPLFANHKAHILGKNFKTKFITELQQKMHHSLKGRTHQNDVRCPL